VLAGINDKRNVGEDIAYSGTLAIGREAAFWNVPAVGISRDAWPDEPDVAAVGLLLRTLWQTRDMWTAAGTWLALNLPRNLPARIRQASPAHDKIASAADVVESEAGRLVYRLRRGRPGSAKPGDENDVLAGGAILVTRYAANAARPLADSTLAQWAALLQ
jgi:5'-nucleotidase